MSVEPKLMYFITDDAPEMTLDLLGGKGYNLSVMTKIGVNVPPAVVITTEACRRYQKAPATVMALVKKEMVPMIKKYLTESMGYMPLVSVRSGAKFSMPGMMDTILNVGLDAKTDKFWRDKLGDACVVDSVHRLIVMYGGVVKGIDRKKLEDVDMVTALTRYSDLTGDSFPTADEQLLGAIEAVFKSWNNDRAKSYRRMNGIPDDIGTAVVVQAMVFGNLNEKSATGVLFTRNPSSGENDVVGEFLVKAQGEDVVDGSRTPLSLTELKAWDAAAAEELMNTVVMLEEHYKDMQDVEFTVQDGKLFILQTRSGKRTASAAIKIAVDMVEEKLIDAKTAVSRVTLKQFLTATRPMIDPTFKTPPTIKGIPASNGVAKGVAVMTSKDAVASKVPCILVSDETTPDDIEGMNAAVGILTRKGGATSHAAVVARGMDKVCVVGCTGLPSVLPGTQITLDGASGSVWLGMNVPVVDGSKMPEVEALKSLVAEAYPYLRVTTTAADVTKNRSYFATFELDDVSQADLDAELKAVVSSMEAGVIDLTPRAMLLEGADKDVDSMYGLVTGQMMTVMTLQKVTALLKVPVKAKDIWVVVGQFLKDVEKKALTEHGYKVVPVVDDLKTLIMAEGGLVMWAPGAAAKMDGPAAVKVMSLKKAAGETMESLHLFSEVDKNVFNTGARVAMSDMAAMQSLLG